MISQDELRRLSDEYKQIAGFSLDALKRCFRPGAVHGHRVPGVRGLHTLVVHHRQIGALSVNAGWPDTAA